MPDLYGGAAGELFILGEAIQAARKAAGLTQAELAREIERTRLTVSKYETGYRAPSYLDLIYIARACKIPVSVLIRALDSFHAPPPKTIRAQETSKDRNPYGAKGSPTKR